MNQRIDFTRSGGFPFTQDTFAYMQDSYRNALSALATVFGQLVIVTGVADLGGSWGDGWVSINGELMPFVGGVKKDKIIVEEITDTEIFGDDVENSVYFKKTAKLGITGGNDFTDFVRAKSIAQIEDGLNKKGMITMWSGSVSAVPSGWGLCDGGGTPARPDLRGRFIVGYDSTKADYNAIGKTGGEEKHTLTESEMPSHRHSAPPQNGVDGMPSVGELGLVRRTAGGENKTAQIDSAGAGVEVDVSMVYAMPAAGGGQSHENRPPYYTLAYIIKL